jgi:protein gp37
MAETTEISWAHSTFNPWIGCTRVSPGCDNCYAATLMQDRYRRVTWGAGEARSRTKTWDQPRRWNKLAKASGEPWRVFCASLADVFDNEVPGEWRQELGQLIMDTPYLTWMLLTKRIGNVKPMMASDFRWDAMPGNVWLGITVVNQAEADRDIPKLLQVPAKVRWLSCEPLLGGIDLRNYLTDCYVSPRVDWVIVGGESGAGARPMPVEWVREIRDDCAFDGVPFKQWGGVRPKSNGHLLDGAEHRAFPA